MRMRKVLVLAAPVISLLSHGVSAAESDCKGEVTAAAMALGEKPNYSWRETVVIPETFQAEPSEGKTEKGGFTYLTSRFDVLGYKDIKAVQKGDKAVISAEGTDWQSLTDLEGAQGRRLQLKWRLSSLKLPAVQAAQLAAAAKDLKKEGDVCAGELTEDGAKSFLLLRGGGGTVTNPKGSVKFWLKDGALTKYEWKLNWVLTLNATKLERNRNTTVIIKDVGTTRVTVPAQAEKKLLQ